MDETVRILLQVDMVGVAGICDPRQLWPAFPEYWETGRSAMTADALAAIEGLLEGGATEITLVEIHGPVTGKIIDSDQLPDSVTHSDERTTREALVTGAPPFDALLQVGFHARCGTQNGFVSHTEGPDLRIAVDGKAVTESHLNAWRAGLPLLGVVGDAALERQLDNGLAGTPFLAVKTATSRAVAEPIFESSEQSSVAIHAFARWCLEHYDDRTRARLPERFTLTISMRPELADLIEGKNGLLRTSPAILAMSCTDWWYDAEPAVLAALVASYQPWQRLASGVDESSLEAIADVSPQLQRVRDYWLNWVSSVEPEWRT